MTTLVTGSAGHLGEAIVRTLRRAGRPVRGLDRRPSPFTDEVGSIEDRGFVRQAIPEQLAAWITEDVVPIPKNIYGVTKVGAEGLCELFARKRGLSVIVLRTSRFFPEADDDESIRERGRASPLPRLRRDLRLEIVALCRHRSRLRQASRADRPRVATSLRATREVRAARSA